MTYPHFTSAQLPLGARSFAFRSNPAQFIDDRKTNPSTMHFESAVAAGAYCHMPPTRPPERHPQKILTDPTYDVVLELTLI